MDALQVPVKGTNIAIPHELVIVTKRGEGAPTALVAVQSGLEFFAFRLSSASD